MSFEDGTLRVAHSFFYLKLYDYSTLYHKNALQVEASIIQDALFTVVRRVSPGNRSLEQAQECD